MIHFNSNMDLLVKASRISDASELSGSELESLSQLLNMDKLFEQFPETMLRKYRDRYSGQYIQGMKINRSASGDLMSFSFIPYSQASRVQIYDGFIFSIINPAARNLARILFWLNTSDYAQMSLSEVAGWGNLSDSLFKVKDLSRYIEIISNPGPMIAPLFRHDTSNLLVLDALMFKKGEKFQPLALERLYFENDTV